MGEITGEFHNPFLGSARALTARQLKHFHRMHRGVYVSTEVARTQELKARAAWLWAKGDGVVAGRSAAALLGTQWIDDHLPAQLIRGGSRRSVHGIDVRGEVLLPEEVITIDGIRTTSPARTGFDLARWLEHDRAVEALDALCQATGLLPHEILALAGRHPGARGSKQLRSVISLVDPGAQSPPETRTRLLIIRAGLPKPQTQVEVHNEWGYVIATCDLGWKRWRVAAEYDGAHHWLDPAQRTKDIDRYEELPALGWKVVRVGADLLRHRPHIVIERLRAKLREAGCPT